jgi:hypothetical protein
MRAYPTILVLLLTGCGGQVNEWYDSGSSDAGPLLDTGSPFLDAFTEGAPMDAALDAQQEWVGMDGGAPVACKADPSPCVRLRITDCVGWDCNGPLASFDGQECRAAGGTMTGQTINVCGPYWVSSYIGDPAGNGCVQFAGNWCTESYGSPTFPDGGDFGYDYACPPDGGPPKQSGCVEIGGDSIVSEWCCHTRPTCSPWTGQPQCPADGGQTYLGFGGAMPSGCFPLGAASVAQGLLYCCSNPADGGPLCQP